MNGANYLTLRGKLVNWTSEDILKVVQENIDNIDIGDKGKEPWEPIEDNKEDNSGSDSSTIVGEWERI